MKVKTKFLIMFVIAILTILLMGATKVNATDTEIAEEKFCIFSMYDKDGNWIENMGQGDATYQEIVWNIEDITEGAYYQINTQINLGQSIELKGLGNFKLSRTYNNEDDPEDTSTYYEYKSEAINISEIKQKSQTLEFDLKDIDTNIVQHFTMDVSYYGFSKQTYTVNNSEEIGMGIMLDGKTELGVSLKANKIKDNEETYIQMKNLITASSAINIVHIYACDISIVGGNYEGDLTITFNIGTEYDNKIASIVHRKKNGESEIFEKTIVNGKVTITVNELSPFMIAVQEEKINNNSNSNNNNNTTATPQKPNTQTSNKGQLDDTPKTGGIDIIYYVLPIAIISATGIIVLRRKETK